jgi:probable F420-dependent oxidoreductase
MKFGVSLPTCKEGLNLPLPFCTADELIELIELADELGYDSAWGNDHITAPAYVRENYAEPPRFYEPLMIFAAAARVTKRIRLGTGVLVLPLREPVLLAKQLATLDRLSHGRVIAGVGVGAYREELELANPRLAARANRGRLLDESIEALRLLLTGERASFDGEYHSFGELQLQPAPVQDPLPLYIGGNSPQALERTARCGHGWLPGAIPRDRLRDGRAEIRRRAEELGRDPQAISIAPQYLCCIGKSREEALSRFRASPMYVHLQSLSGSTLRGQPLEAVENANLVGTPAQIAEQIHELHEAGVDELGAMSFISATSADMARDMTWFKEEVMAEFVQ